MAEIKFRERGKNWNGIGRRGGEREGAEKSLKIVA